MIVVTMAIIVDVIMIVMSTEAIYMIVGAVRVVFAIKIVLSWRFTDDRVYFIAITLSNYIILI